MAEEGEGDGEERKDSEAEDREEGPAFAEEHEAVEERARRGSRKGRLIWTWIRIGEKGQS